MWRAVDICRHHVKLVRSGFRSRGSFIQLTISNWKIKDTFAWRFTVNRVHDHVFLWMCCSYKLNNKSSHFHRQSLQSSNQQHENYQQSFDIRTLKALNVLRHSPVIQDQRPPQTVYQEQFGLQSPLFPQGWIVFTSATSSTCWMLSWPLSRL